MTRARVPAGRALVVGAVGALAFVGALQACKIGPSSSLLDGATLEIVIAGLDANEAVHLEVDDDVRDAAAAGNPTVMYLALDAGAHTGQLVVGHGDAARCTAISVVTDDKTTVLAFDARQLPLCSVVDVDAGPDGGPDAGAGEGEGEGEGGLPDAGLPDAGFPDAGFPDAGFPDAGVDVGIFRALSETVNDLVCLPPCSKITEADADGTLTVTDHAAAPQVGAINDADLIALANEVDSDAANRLFAGQDLLCPQQGLTNLVVLRRTVDDGSGPRSESVDVSTCLDGTAHSLRARLELLRSLLP